LKLVVICWSLAAIKKQHKYNEAQSVIILEVGNIVKY